MPLFALRAAKLLAASGCSRSAWGAAGALAPGEAEAALLKMSTLSEEGIMEVKQTACDRLLSSRVEMKMKVHHTPLQVFRDCMTCHVICRSTTSLAVSDYHPQQVLLNLAAYYTSLSHMSISSEVWRRPQRRLCCCRASA